MARAEAVPAVRRNGRAAREHAVPEVIHLQRAGIFGLPLIGIIASRHDDGETIVGRKQDLVRENPGVHRSRLFDFGADHSVRIDAVDCYSARIVVGGEEKFGASVGRIVDGPGCQRRGRAVRSERAARGVDAKGARMVRLADEPADA